VSLFMVLTTAVAIMLMLIPTSRRAVVPGRWQNVAEMSYEFAGSMLRSSTGAEGMRFFPLVFSLFMFILVANMIGMFPYFYTVTSQLVVTLALALIVFLTVVIAGIRRHGTRFFRLFVPSGVPLAILPLVSTIEVISFLSRPVSHSVRLFANMLAGHITLKVFAAFVASLGALGFVGVVGAILPLIMTVAITALEFLVAGLQAYVFAVLTCLYLNDALHPGH
jgi:F-type H+-transporting ATPase subunit a